jgi:hypothetical protein
MDQTLDIFIDELMTNEELRYSFVTRPQQTLRLADEWALPLCESEIRTLIAMEPAMWDRVAEALSLRLREAA